MKMLKKTALAIGVSTIMLAQATHAGLYVSPVVRDNVSVNPATYQETGDNQSGMQVTGASKSGNFVMQEKPLTEIKPEAKSTVVKKDPVVEKAPIVTKTPVITEDPSINEDPATPIQNIVDEPSSYGFGSNVPLFVALENIIPLDQYTVNIDDIIQDRAVSWTGGNAWRDVLKSIAEQNDLAITLNDNDHVIGISTDIEVSEALAQTERNVWRIIEGKSLKENLDSWASQSGWEIYWDVRVDYPMKHSAVLFGDMKSSLEVLLSSFSDNAVPLSAVFYKGNNVIKIIEGGSKRGV